MVHGDSRQRLDITSHDEIGSLAEAFNLFMEKLQKLISISIENAGSVDESSIDLVKLARMLSSEAASTSDKSTAVAAATEEMSSNINSVAASMEEASANINMMSSATEEMSSTIREIARKQLLWLLGQSQELLLLYSGSGHSILRLVFLYAHHCPD